MSSVIQPEELSLAKRYYTLSEGYDSRPIIARRGTLPSLLKFLSHVNREVRFVSVQTIALLADHPENPEVICRQEGLVQQLFDLYKSSESEDPEMNQLISMIFESLKPALAAGAKDGDGSEPNIAEGESVRTVKNRPTRIKRNGGSVTYRSMTLAVYNLETKEDADELGELLQTTKGIISYTVETGAAAAIDSTTGTVAAAAADGGAATVSLYLTTPTSSLMKLLLDQGFDCDVTKDVVVDNQYTPALAGHGPSYRNSDTDKAVNKFLNSLVVHGAKSNSLSERLKRQKEERDRKAASERSSISSFMSNLTKGWW